MAEKGFADSLAKLLEDLDCSVCFESTQLLLLPCQHRFCEPCIKRLTCPVKRTIDCPECRRNFKVPTEGYPVCRLSQAMRDQVEKALQDSYTSGSEVEAPTPPLVSPAEEKKPPEQLKDSEELVCDQCDRKMECRCCYCKKFLCYRCIVKSSCADSKDKHRHLASADMEYILIEADNTLSTWKYCIFKELEEVKVPKERKYKRAIVVATEDVIDLETDLIERILMIEQITKTDIFGKSMEPDEEPIVRITARIGSAEGATTRRRSQAELTDRIAERVTLKRQSKKHRSMTESVSVENITHIMEESRVASVECVSPESQEKKAKALYTFNQTDIGEGVIGILEGEVFTVLQRGEDGWTEILKDSGVTGIVPTNHIHFLQE